MLMDGVERTHVHSVYSQIASHFSDTRYKPWPRIEEFLKSQPPGSLIADVGCGNGKYLGVNPLAYKVGSDICPELTAIARQRGHEVAVCDCLHLPYRAGAFDAAICIAVVHHLSTEERRLRALREMARILRPGGSLLVYVWAMEQEGRKFDRQDVLVPWHLQPKYLDRTKDPTSVPLSKTHLGGRGKRRNATKGVTTTPARAAHLLSSEGARRLEEAPAAESSAEEGSEVSQDNVKSSLSVVTSKSEPLLPPPQPTNRESGDADKEPNLRELGYQTFLRYYHVFQKGELTDLLRRGVPELILREEVYDHDNWCVTAHKGTPSLVE